MRNLQLLLATALPVAAMLGVVACTSDPGVTSSPSSASSSSRSASAPVVGGPVPPCTIPQLKITLTRRGAAVTGQVGGYLRFVNAGRAACQLHGWPKVTAITTSGQTIMAVRALHGTMLGAWQYTSPLPTVRLAPGAAAYAVLAAGDHSADGSTRCPSVRLLRVTSPGSSRHVALTAQLYDHVYLPACTSASGSTEIEFSAVVPRSDLAR
jgi:hypothetical protein